MSYKKSRSSQKSTIESSIYSTQGIKGVNLFLHSQTPKHSHQGPLSPLNHNFSSTGHTFLSGGHITKGSHNRKRSAIHRQMMKAQFQSVSLTSDFTKVDSRGLVNPYSFKFNDGFMQKETAPNYYPPLLRKQMNEFMNKTSIRLEGPQPLVQAPKIKSNPSELQTYETPQSDLKNINQIFDDTFRIKKVKRSPEQPKKKPQKITPIQAKIIASQLSFGNKLYDDPSKLKNIGVGKVELIPEKQMQFKMSKPLGADVPSKQFMKTINFKNEDRSLSKTSYQLADKSIINQNFIDQIRFSQSLRHELKKSSIEYGFEGNPDYLSMKKIMQDSGHEGFIAEKRKKRQTVNNILPNVKATPNQIYAEVKIPPKRAEKKKTEPFQLKRQGSQLSIIREKTGKSNIYALNKGQNVKTPISQAPENDYLKVFKSLTTKHQDHSTLGLINHQIPNFKQKLMIPSFTMSTVRHKSTEPSFRRPQSGISEVNRPPSNYFERMRGTSANSLVTQGLETQKLVNEQARHLAQYFKSSNVQLQMQRPQSKYQLELDKEKQQNLILQNQSPEAINERLHGHRTENRNFKKYLNLMQASKTDKPISYYKDTLGSYNTIDYRQAVDTSNHLSHLASQYQQQNHYKLGENSNSILESKIKEKEIQTQKGPQRYAEGQIIKKDHIGGHFSLQQAGKITTLSPPKIGHNSNMRVSSNLEFIQNKQANQTGCVMLGTDSNHVMSRSQSSFNPYRSHSHLDASKIKLKQQQSNVHLGPRIKSAASQFSLSQSQHQWVVPKYAAPIQAAGKK